MREAERYITPPASTASTGRAALIGSGASLLLLDGAEATQGAPAPAPQTTETDAELMRLGVEFQRLERRRGELEHSRADDDENMPEECEKELLALVPVMDDLAEKIADQSSVTSAGLRVKAATLLSYAHYWADDRLIWGNHDQLLGWSIARDLLGATAAGPQGKRTALPGATEAAAADAELLAACEAFEQADVRLNDLNAHSPHAPFGDPLTIEHQVTIYRMNDAWLNAVYSIAEHPARTPQGILAKARVTQRALEQHLDAVGDAKAHEALALSVLADLAGMPVPPPTGRFTPAGALRIDAAWTAPPERVEERRVQSREY